MKFLLKRIAGFITIKMSVKDWMTKFFKKKTVFGINWSWNFIEIYILVLHLEIITYFSDKFRTKSATTKMSLSISIVALNPSTK